MVEFAQVRNRVWVARYHWLDLNVTVVGGQRGVAVVDTQASERAGRELLAAVHALAAGPVVAVINTHEHSDHVFGNAAFRAEDPEVSLHAHEVACARTAASGEQVKAAFAADPDDPHRNDILATRIVPADRPFTTSTRIDLGDRDVVLQHFGRGHTGGDAVVAITDVDVVLAGDLVEESGPPALGDDSFPLDWAPTLERLLGQLSPDSLVVPGHGAVVDRSFVDSQAGELQVVADTIRSLAASGIPVGDATDAAAWPWNPDHLRHAIRRGYQQIADAARHVRPAADAPAATEPRGHGTAAESGRSSP